MCNSDCNDDHRLIHSSRHAKAHVSPLELHRVLSNHITGILEFSYYELISVGDPSDCRTLKGKSFQLILRMKTLQQSSFVHS